MAFLEKATPENTKNATKCGVKILNGKFTKMKKQIIIMFMTLCRIQNQSSYKTPVFVSRTET